MKPRSRKVQSLGRGTVRAAQLEVTLEGFNKEMGVKSSVSIENYHLEYVGPRLKRLENHVDWLELPWYKRLFTKRPTDETVVVDGIPVGEEVVTTEVGAQYFDGEPQTGIVVKREPGKIHVRIDELDEVQIFSPAAWTTLPEEDPEDAV